ncbi:hypothetical protein [Kordia sp.]|uniref:hypothetical protein n=1 Tax=Kordia sp. TaxID=1965332 RepID=UPI003D2C26D3
MRRFLILSIFLLLATSCTSLKEQLQDEKLFTELSEGFTLQKLPNWTFHGFHGVLNYTPIDLMDIGKEYIYNNVSAYKSKEPTSKDLKTVITDQLNRRFSHISNMKMYTATTKYGHSIVLTYDSQYGETTYNCIYQFYKYKRYVYRVAYVAKVEYFDTYYNDAITIMKTFTITE